MSSRCSVRSGVRWLGAALLAAALTAVAGCGGGPPYKTAKVSGKVVYDDGTPIKAGTIRLDFFPQVEPIDAKTPPKTGQATVNPDGTFDSATTWKPGDGAIVGKHKVCVLAYDEKDPTKFSRAVPDIYRNPLTTPLEATVTAGGMEPTELKVRRK